MSRTIRTTVIHGPTGQIAVVSSVRDSRLLPVRHTVGRVLTRACLPVAVFLDHPRPTDVAIGSAAAFKGTFADAVAFAEAMVADPEAVCPR
jgi:hypothetical protein